MHQVYRVLSVLVSESDYIQSRLFRNSLNRPLPIVEMGLFRGRDGIPLAFYMNPGNRNEQLSLIPLGKTLMEKFDMSQFIVCTVAELSSHTNRYFNNNDKEDGTRDFMATQSVKKLK